MRTEQFRFTEGQGWEPAPGGLTGAQLVLLFGGTRLLRERLGLRELRGAYPGAHLMGCSTSGEILGTAVGDDTLVATAVRFDRARVAGASARIGDASESRAVGERLARALPAEGLLHVFVLSDGLRVNGSELVAGLTGALPASVTVTGGLSGDGALFQQTLVVYDGDPAPDTVAALGFYGEDLRVGFGSLGGWDPFGPERKVTRSSGNVLFELDGGSALELYRKYLGEHAAGLPATGLLFPLAVRVEGSARPVVRTILAVDPGAQSLTFAGDVPEGAYAQLMKANFDRLVDGASGAARASAWGLRSAPAELAILISCVGRKLVLKQRVEEEVEGVRDVLGPSPALVGFYSYGEIAPFAPAARCELHNQTMTITTFAEI